ncbi:hypothetical protein GmHk_09G025542 [Glycine max]|nr:hypothetical protein GmHk_09G025542 [Glycine max]
MLESFQQQDQMSVLELYIEKDVAGGSMFHSANSLTSCGNNLSNNEAQPPRNVSNLHGDEDDDDYLVSNSYVEESLDEDDSVDSISDTNDEVTNMIQPVRIVHPAEAVAIPEAEVASRNGDSLCNSCACTPAPPAPLCLPNPSLCTYIDWTCQSTQRDVSTLDTPMAVAITTGYVASGSGEKPRTLPS